MKRFKYVGDHAQDLADGRIVGPSETVELDSSAEKDNERLINDGLLIEAATKKRKEDA